MFHDLRLALHRCGRAKPRANRLIEASTPEQLHICPCDAVTSANDCCSNPSEGQNPARIGSQRASEASSRGEIDASHHGGTLQNAALTCTNTVPRQRGTAPRERIPNVEYPRFKCGASIWRLSRARKAAGQRHQALTRKQAVHARVYFVVQLLDAFQQIVNGRFSHPRKATPTQAGTGLERDGA